MKLREYQKDIYSQIISSEENLLCQLDTGGGKTHIIASLSKNHRKIIVVAHRNILVKQASKMLAKFGVKHNTISSKYTRKLCGKEHKSLGIDMLNSSKNKFVASIDSIISRYNRGLLKIDMEAEYILLVDEAHHMIEDNKWGKLLQIFKNSRIIGFTATPCRLDGKSLSVKNGGVFDKLIQAKTLKKESMRTLISQGNISDYKCFSIPSRIDEDSLKMGKNDYTYNSLCIETGKVTLQMAGDAIEHYKMLAYGKQGVVFCVSIEIAKEVAKQFKKAGIPSASIHSKMGNAEASRIFDLFEKEVIKVLVNVDMIGEGVDVPKIEALIMLRKTASFGLFRQWVGRSLRIEESKEFAIIIDHVGNIQTHGLPDKHIDWSLENPYEAQKSNLIPCPNCNFIVNAWDLECPECGEILRLNGELSQINMKYLDMKLIEIKRNEAEQIELEKNKREAEELKFRTEIELHSVNTSMFGSLVERKIHDIKLWFCEVINNELNVSIAEINTFFRENSNEFFLRNFTLVDKVQNNKQKVINEFRKCQK